MAENSPLMKPAAGSQSHLAPHRRKAEIVDWIAVRRAFIERPERPTLGELAAEFGVNPNRLERACRDDGWATMRATFAEERLKQSDAAMALLNAAKREGAVTRAFTDAALEVCSQVHTVVQDLSKKKVAEATRANTLNSCAFTLSNLANALARVGVVGLPKALKDSAGVDSGNGRWNPAMLQALNVTVQNIMATAPATAPAPPPDAISEAPAAAAGEEHPAALPEASGAALEVPAVERELVPAGCSVTTVTEPAKAVGGHADSDSAALV